MNRYFFIFLLLAMHTSTAVFAHPFTPCDENIGMADIYPCKKIDLLSRVHIDYMGGTAQDNGNDIWGWTDPETQKEYALMGLSHGTYFVDISDPKNPIKLGILPPTTTNNLWRDIKTYKNTAYIVSQAQNHGMQVFDLTQLRNVSNPPTQFSATKVYTQFKEAHNIVINEDTGFAYAVGTETCAGGLHMIDIRQPQNPQFAGCFAADGYTHDAQCVTYVGPDTDYTGKEICFNANEDTVTIVNVTDKNNPQMISRTPYSNSQYTHQGWLTEDQRYFLFNDELDEQAFGFNTRTYILDVLNLDSPQLIGYYSGPKKSIDHNLYVKGNLVYMTNYTSGLRIVDLNNIGSANLHEIASFDTFPADDSAHFDGAWSSYPYFASGNVIVSDFSGGLFILDPKLCPASSPTQGLTATANGDNSIQLDWNLDLQAGEHYKVYRSLGGCQADNFTQIADNVSTNSFIDDDVSGGVKIGYKINRFIPNDNDVCESERSICVETQTTGSCSIAPNFSGISSATSSNNATCGIDLSWNQATAYCGNQARYNIYRSQTENFTANNASKIASNINATTWHDASVYNAESYYYIVRAVDTNNNSEDSNHLILSTKVQGTISNGTWNAGAEIGDGGINKGFQKHPGWDKVSNRKHSGERSYWSHNNSNSCNPLTTDLVTLTANKQSKLTFWSAYAIDYQFDGGIVEVSNPNATWDKPTLSPQYPGVFRNSQDVCGYKFNDKSFTGTDLTWREYSMDLSQYNGQDIQIRFNYSSDAQNNGEGWFIDDIALTNVQIPSQCTTVLPQTSPQAGLWYDKSRNGHGFVIEPIGNEQDYFTIFYSYKDDGTPEWYTSLAKLENGVLNINLDNNTLQRFTYDFNSTAGNPSLLDESIGTTILSIDFNSDNLGNPQVCNDGQDRGAKIAVAHWQIGEQTGDWCLSPIIAQNNIPTNDLGGTWWAGNDDSGWGLSLAFSNDTLIAIVYYYDAQGQPRWVLGSKSGFAIDQEITIDMAQFQGFARDAQALDTTNTPAGTLTLKLNNDSPLASGELSIDINYQGNEGGNWQRSQLAIKPLTNIH